MTPRIARTRIPSPKPFPPLRDLFSRQFSDGPIPTEILTGVSGEALRHMAQLARELFPEGMLGPDQQVATEIIRLIVGCQQGLFADLGLQPVTMFGRRLRLHLR